MADMKVQKIKLLKIWEILNWKSDEQHPLSTQDIIDIPNKACQIH